LGSRTHNCAQIINMLAAAGASLRCMQRSELMATT